MVFLGSFMLRLHHFYTTTALRLMSGMLFYKLYSLKNIAICRFMKRNGESLRYEIGLSGSDTYEKETPGKTGCFGR